MVAAGLSRNWALPQVLAFWSAGGPGWVAPSGGLSVCATLVFRLWPGPLVRRFVEARRGFKQAWRKPGWFRRPAQLLLGFQAGSPAFVFGPAADSNSAGWFWPNPALKRTRAVRLAP